MGSSTVAGKGRNIRANMVGKQGLRGPAGGTFLPLAKPAGGIMREIARARVEANYIGKSFVLSLTRITAWFELTRSSRVSGGRAPRRKT